MAGEEFRAFARDGRNLLVAGVEDAIFTGSHSGEHVPVPDRRGGFSEFAVQDRFEP